MTHVREAAFVPLEHAWRNALEVALLAAVGGFVLFTMCMTYVATRPDTSRHDLTYAGATDELSAWLRANGPDAIARVTPASLRIGGETVVVDTLELVADTTREPGLAAGGFVRDQIVEYNDRAIRNAVLVRTRGRAWARAGGMGGGASLLRTIAADGGRRISDAVDPYAIVIRSPHAEGDWREVRTIDWRSDLALVGLHGTVALAPDLESRSRVELNGNDCTVRRTAPRYLFYCASPLGADVGRFFDFGLRVNPAGRGATGYAYRQSDVWLNGRRTSFGSHALSGGDVLDVPRLGSVMLTVADQGTLAAEQWINGRRRFTEGDLGTLSIFGSAGRTSFGSRRDPLVLSFDGAFTADLEAAAGAFISANGDALARMAVVALDIRTGEVRAIAEPGRRHDDEPLLSFEPILVGSAAKPIVAAAILAEQPQFANLRLPYAGDEVTSVAGAPLRVPFENERNGCTGDIDFDSFIRCSSNQYAAELLVRSLERNGYRPSAGTIVPRAVLEHSAVGTGLAEAFDVDAFGGRTRGRNTLYWNPDTSSASGVGVATNRGLLPWESRPWIVFPDSAGTRVDWLARYAFGGWENRWTLLGLAQAYARIASGRAVQANFVHRPSQSLDAFDTLGTKTAAAMGRVREALAQVPVNGTAAGLAQRLARLAGSPITVLAKTGTLNETGPAGHFKALALAMGPAANASARAALACGLVVVSYFEFSDDWAGRRGTRALPPVHVDFAAGPLQAVVARHWRQIVSCPDSVTSNERTTRAREGERR